MKKMITTPTTMVMMRRLSDNVQDDAIYYIIMVIEIRKIMMESLNPKTMSSLIHFLASTEL